MDDAPWHRDEPDSPCQNVCLIHPRARICIGCHRRPEEIAGWARLGAGERARIRAELPGRAHLLRAAANRPSRRKPGKSAANRGENPESGST
ncbi:MAG: DUF1289 domain-containing protein [Alphaproteobacteria bacterium]|nr:MAG: DUF1289 domain-containing protein [Alphaproteobacteria bacterium]